MELLGDILSYHQNHPADVPHHSQVHHRIAYTGTAIFTVKLLQTILPPEKVCSCVCAVKSHHITALCFISVSYCFCDSHTGKRYSPRKHSNSSFSLVLGCVIGKFITQHARVCSGLLGASELRQPWSLQEGNQSCFVDGINLQLPEGSAGWGTICSKQLFGWLWDRIQ